LVTVRTDARVVEERPTPGVAMPLVIEGVRRSWGSRLVLDGVSLALAPGTAAWLGGSNGAGKTTLLRIAAGLLAPDRGRVSALGLDCDRDRRAYQRAIGFLSAGDRGLQARLTVAQNLELWAALALIPRQRRRALVEAVIARFELAELRSRRVERLSMGQRQRVRLAGTFLHEPAVVLLDEPHTSLDELGLALLEDAAARVTSAGGVVLWCSPSPSPALAADEAYLLHDGRVVRQ
jgi:ABC-2 type transport system ATP-binding protein